MKTKDKQDEAQRHARRDAIIRAVFKELVYHENYSFECAYIFIGEIWGFGRSKLVQIVNAKDECPLSGYNFAKKAVILHRISKNTMKNQLQLIVAAGLAFAGIALLYVGALIAPQGEIHESILVAFGEVATFAGSIIGIDYRYKLKNHDNTHPSKNNPTGESGKRQAIRPLRPGQTPDV